MDNAITIGDVTYKGNSIYYKGKLVFKDGVLDIGKQDYVNVIRCRNCEYGTQDIPSAMFNCSKLFARVAPSGFCAWARAKQDE